MGVGGGWVAVFMIKRSPELGNKLRMGSVAIVKFFTTFIIEELFCCPVGRGTRFIAPPPLTMERRKKNIHLFGNPDILYKKGTQKTKIIIMK